MNYLRWIVRGLEKRPAEGEGRLQSGLDREGVVVEVPCCWVDLEDSCDVKISRRLLSRCSAMLEF
jgi:hypothetical protein